MAVLSRRNLADTCPASVPSMIQPFRAIAGLSTKMGSVAAVTAATMSSRIMTWSILCPALWMSRV
jgi:hypothetical protein